MTEKVPDPLMAQLMQLAASAAPLLKRAREAGVFTAPHEASEASAPPPDMAALQQVVISQAVRIAALEAEIATLKKPRAKPSKPRKS